MPALIPDLDVQEGQVRRGFSLSGVSTQKHMPSPCKVCKCSPCAHQSHGARFITPPAGRVPRGIAFIMIHHHHHHHPHLHLAHRCPLITKEKKNRGNQTYLPLSYFLLSGSYWYKRHLNRAADLYLVIMRCTMILSYSFLQALLIQILAPLEVPAEGIAF